MLAELEALPDGEWEFSDYGDQDVMADGKPPIYVHCKLTKTGTKLSFDWTQSDPQPRASWGAARATLIGAKLSGLHDLLPRAVSAEPRDHPKPGDHLQARVMRARPGADADDGLLLRRLR